MYVVVAYDVSTETAEGKQRLRRVANICLAHGQRVQKSLFECLLNESQFETLKESLKQCVKKNEDSLRIYILSFPRERCLWMYGVQHDIDYTDTLIV